MERFTQHANTDGVVDVRRLTVGRESELFRALNMHFNKANDFQVTDKTHWKYWRSEFTRLVSHHPEVTCAVLFGFNGGCVFSFWLCAVHQMIFLCQMWVSCHATFIRQVSKLKTIFCLLHYICISSFATVTHFKGISETVTLFCGFYNTQTIVNWFCNVCFLP